MMHNTVNLINYPLKIMVLTPQLNIHPLNVLTMCQVILFQSNFLKIYPLENVYLYIYLHIKNIDINFKSVLKDVQGVNSSSLPLEMKRRIVKSILVKNSKVCKFVIQRRKIRDKAREDKGTDTTI